MKRIISFLAIALLTINISAQTFEVGGINYNITSTNTVEVIAKEPQYEGDIIIPEQVSYNGITYNVTAVGDNAFYYCSGLTSITIPNSVITIGKEGFQHCSGLTLVTIGNSIDSIRDRAFFGCYGLKEITCLATTPPSLGLGVFPSPNQSIRILYVPIGSGENYKNSNYQ